LDLRYAAPVGIIQWQTCFGYLWPPDILCLLLLDDPANELFLSRWTGRPSHSNRQLAGREKKSTFREQDQFCASVSSSFTEKSPRSIRCVNANGLSYSQKA
jgi:hypothetical protein